MIARDLTNSTGVPSRFDIEFYCEVGHAKNFETEIHGELWQYRFEKEFFKCQISKAVEVVKIVASSGRHVFYGSGGRSASAFLTAKEQKEIIRLAEQNRLLAERKRIQEELLRQEKMRLYEQRETEKKAIESAIWKWEAIFRLKTKEALEQAEKEYGKTLESIEKRGFFSTTEDIIKSASIFTEVAMLPVLLLLLD